MRVLNSYDNSMKVFKRRTQHGNGRFWEQLPTGKEDKPLLFEMGPLEYDFMILTDCILCWIVDYPAVCL